MTLEFWHQKISSPLAIVLVGLMAFWTILYYFTNRATDIADAWSIAGQTRTQEAAEQKVQVR